MEGHIMTNQIFSISVYILKIFTCIVLTLVIAEPVLSANGIAVTSSEIPRTITTPSGILVINREITSYQQNDISLAEIPSSFLSRVSFDFLSKQETPISIAYNMSEMSQSLEVHMPEGSIVSIKNHENSNIVVSGIVPQRDKKAFLDQVNSISNFDDAFAFIFAKVYSKLGSDTLIAFDDLTATLLETEYAPSLIVDESTRSVFDYISCMGALFAIDAAVFGAAACVSCAGVILTAGISGTGCPACLVATGLGVTAFIAAMGTCGPLLDQNPGNGSGGGGGGGGGGGCGEGCGGGGGGSTIIPPFGGGGGGGGSTTCEFLPNGDLVCTFQD